jgi:hypothetical protein
MTTDTQTTSPDISEFEDATTARWLKDALEPARRQAQAVPTAEAVDRMRERVFGEGTAPGKQRKIAA